MQEDSISAAWSKSAIRFEGLGRQTAGFGVSLRQWGLTGGPSHTFSTMQEATCSHPIGRSIQKCVLGHTNSPYLTFCTLVLYHTGLFPSSYKISSVQVPIAQKQRYLLTSQGPLLATD
ncbi:hypothetical protein PoMZ_13574 [Pyricularia oryzae]|uniref:Uncharacterized protein n=1 Tax=Pyricularia oryzae TaxID=318829 RepID=A0A4P7NVQ1_PYROR|nr:hypothetical protein PoMZ_13574 [Pyricularia oryzae]